MTGGDATIPGKKQKFTKYNVCLILLILLLPARWKVPSMAPLWAARVWEGTGSGTGESGTHAQCRTGSCSSCRYPLRWDRIIYPDLNYDVFFLEFQGRGNRQDSDTELLLQRDSASFGTRS